MIGFSVSNGLMVRFKKSPKIFWCLILPIEHCLRLLREVFKISCIRIRKGLRVFDRKLQMQKFLCKKIQVLENFFTNLKCWPIFFRFLSNCEKPTLYYVYRVESKPNWLLHRFNLRQGHKNLHRIMGFLSIFPLKNGVRCVFKTGRVM